MDETHALWSERLLQHFATEFEQKLWPQYEEKEKSRVRRAELMARAQKPIQQAITQDTAAIEAINELRALKAQNAVQGVKLREFPAGELALEKSRFVSTVTGMHVLDKPEAKEILIIRSPPYDMQFTFRRPGRETVEQPTADQNTGVFGYAIGGCGDGRSSVVSAAVGVIFEPSQDRLIDLFCPYTRYAYDWMDSSSGGYTAHNDGSVGVFINSIKRSGIQPMTHLNHQVSLWSDGTGWYEDHSNQDEDVVWIDDITGGFNAEKDRVYGLWILCEGSCDDNSGSVFGFSFAQAHLQINVPFLVIHA